MSPLKVKVELDPLPRPSQDGMEAIKAPETIHLDGFRQQSPEPALDEAMPATAPRASHAATARQSLRDPFKDKFRILVCCMIGFTGGLTDSAPGALIPYMETHYGIGYAIVSLIFITNALGFIAAAPLVDTIQQHIGRAKTLGLSQLLMTLGYVPLACAAPFPAVIVGYFFIGFGFAITLALNNTFCANFANATTLLGMVHGSYGIGGTIGPLIATSLVAQAQASWGLFYLIPIGFTTVNTVLSVMSFRTYESESDSAEETPIAAHAGRERLAAMFRAFKLRVVILGALFIFAYQGAEVSISGWVISFLIAARDGDPSSVGYVTAGFWAGITIGRFVLSPVGARVGEKLFVYLLILGATIFQLLVWLVPNIIAESVALAIVGLLLGPVYPCATVVLVRNLPRKEQVSGLSVISAFGSSGGAFAPFTTGVMAQALGTFVLHPIAIVLFVVMSVSWYGQPSSRKREE